MVLAYISTEQLDVLKEMESSSLSLDNHLSDLDIELYVNSNSEISGSFKCNLLEARKLSS